MQDFITNMHFLCLQKKEKTFSINNRLKHLQEVIVETKIWVGIGEGLQV